MIFELLLDFQREKILKWISAYFLRMFEKNILRKSAEILLLITHTSYLSYPLSSRYHPDTTPKGYRKDTEGISKGYESHSYRIVIV